MPDNSAATANDSVLEDERFDLIYPPEVRELSWLHWTPLAVARRAARLLVTHPGIRVLDIGCGVGKFCIVGALTTAGHFTGVEQRKSLVDVARDAIRINKIPNTRILHGNIEGIRFGDFDAFYLFNPFEENLFDAGKIDSSVELSLALYKQYVIYVARQLAQAPAGTRLVTYGGYCYEVPNCYECRQKMLDEELKLWVKMDESEEKSSCREDPIEQVEELLGMVLNLGKLRTESTAPPIQKNRKIAPVRHTEIPLWAS
ncbi:MAG: methyltransferase domain-containing protein [Chthoniobacterales bacterium]